MARTVLIVDVDEPVADPAAGSVATLRPELLRTLRDALGPTDLVTTLTSGRFAALARAAAGPRDHRSRLTLAVPRSTASPPPGLPSRVAVTRRRTIASLHDAYADAGDALRLGRRIDPDGTTYLIDDLR